MTLIYVIIEVIISIVVVSIVAWNLRVRQEFIHQVYDLLLP
jgi:hypothetical protein